MDRNWGRVCIALFVVSLLLGPLCPPAAAQAPELLETAALDAYLQRVSATGFAGSVLIAKENQVLVRAGYGLADEAGRVAFTPETVVDVGSLAKQFTAAAILQLEEQGRLRLDETLNVFFPNAPEDRAGITLHQLLTHTAGLPDVAADDLAPLSREAALRQIFSQPLTGVPVDAYHYCNACYSVLAAVIEEVSGQPYPDYMHDRVFAPAGLQHTGFYGEARWKGLVVANGYWNGVDQGSPATWPGPYWAVMGNGGVLSTVDDLARWWTALRTHRVLSPAQTEQLFARQVAQENPDTFYGYGWGIEPSPLGTVITHNGGGIGGNSDVAYVVEQDLLIILLGNRIVYRTITDELPFEVRLFASEARRQLIANLAARDIAPLPAPTFSLLPGLVIGGIALGLAVLLALLLRRQRWRAAQRTGQQRAR
jgi:CubicO group peptidase (beta-lactamase class C family)